MTYHYQLFGQTIASAFACPELLPAPPPPAPAIRFMLDTLDGVMANSPLPRRWLSLGPGFCQFTIGGVTRYRMEAGRTIRVEPLPDADPGDVRLHLLGTAMGVLLHQQGRLPLHVCAVAVNGGAHAFCGASGAGKSTLAAALHRRGLPLLTDDVGLVVAGPPGDAQFYPGVPRIKLWLDTLGHFSLDERDLVRDQTRADKYHLTLGAGFHPDPLPLRRLYVLEQTPGQGAPVIAPLSRHEAIGLLLEHTYRPGLMRQVGDPREHLRQCGQVARAIRAFRYRRPWHLERLDDSVDLLLRHLAEAPQ